MSFPPDPVDVVTAAKPRKKKVYAEVSATITYIADTKDNAVKLAEHFLSRRGIEGSYELLEEAKRSATVKMHVVYRVHGGWRSDFVRKIEYDARDLGVTLYNFTVDAARVEIPEQCPRKECSPCAHAVNPDLRYSDLELEHRYREDREEPVQETPVAPTDAPKRRWFNF